MEKPSSAKQSWDQNEPTWLPLPFMDVDLIRPLCNTGLGKLSLWLVLWKVLPSSSPGFHSGWGEGNCFLLSEAELWVPRMSLWAIFFFLWESFDSLPRIQSHVQAWSEVQGHELPFCSPFGNFDILGRPRTLVPTPLIKNMLLMASPYWFYPPPLFHWWPWAFADLIPLSFLHSTNPYSCFKKRLFFGSHSQSFRLG